MPSGVVADAHLHRALYLIAFAPLDTFSVPPDVFIGLPPVNVEVDPPAISLLARYNVRYVYLGQLERLYYPGRGIEKFGDALAEYLEPVFTSEAVTIYRVRDDGM